MPTSSKSNALTMPCVIAVIVSALGVFSACGIGNVVSRPSIPPPPTAFADLVVHPSSIDFGMAVVKGQAVERTVEVTNPGPQGVRIVFTRIDHRTFQIADNTCGGWLAPHAGCATRIFFEPFHSGRHFGILTYVLEGYADLNIGLRGEAAAH